MTDQQKSGLSSYEEIPATDYALNLSIQMGYIFGIHRSDREDILISSDVSTLPKHEGEIIRLDQLFL